MRILLVLSMILGVTSFDSYAESKCQKYADILHNIQVKKGKGKPSRQQGYVLKKKETKARGKLNKCNNPSERRDKNS